MKKIYYIMSVVLVCFSSFSFAGLGGSESQFSGAGVVGSAKHEMRTLPSGNYSVSTAVVNGITVKQYVSANGVVFAVSWSGPSKPNLVELLGSYNKDFVTNDKVGTENAILSTDKVVFVSAKQNKLFVGRALVKSLAPKDFIFD
jgi:hypothetical protein